MKYIQRQWCLGQLSKRNKLLKSELKKYWSVTDSFLYLLSFRMDQTDQNMGGLFLHADVVIRVFLQARTTYSC